MAHIIAESQFDKLPSEEEMSQKARQIDAFLQERGGSWKRTYLAEDEGRELCEFEAPNPDIIRQAYQQADLPLDRVYAAKVSDTQTPDWH